MNIKLQILLAVIILLQVFNAGIFYENQISWQKELSEKFKTYGLTFLIALMGVLILPAVICIPIAGLFRRIFQYFRLGFVFHALVFRKQLYNFNEERYEQMSKKVKDITPKWYQIDKQIDKRIFRWIAEVYIPKHGFGKTD